MSDALRSCIDGPRVLARKLERVVRCAGTPDTTCPRAFRHDASRNDEADGVVGLAGKRTVILFALSIALAVSDGPAFGQGPGSNFEQPAPAQVRSESTQGLDTTAIGTIDEPDQDLAPPGASHHEPGSVLEIIDTPYERRMRSTPKTLSRLARKLERVVRCAGTPDTTCPRAFRHDASRNDEADGVVGLAGKRTVILFALSIALAVSDGPAFGQGPG